MDCVLLLLRLIVYLLMLLCFSLWVVTLVGWFVGLVVCGFGLGVGFRCFNFVLCWFDCFTLDLICGFF